MTITIPLEIEGESLVLDLHSVYFGTDWFSDYLKTSYSYSNGVQELGAS